MTQVRYHIAAGLLLAGCGTPSNGVVHGADVVSLRIEPASVDLRAEADAPAEQAFTAIATFGDGEEGELDLVSWELSNASVGALDSRGHFTSVDTNGGEATITATFLDHTATADLSLVHSAAYFEDGLDAAVAEAFAAADAGSESMAILYPLDGTTVPRNLEGLEVEWSGSSAGEVQRLHFASALETVDVYLKDRRAWTVPVEVWEAVSATNSRGELEVVVASADWDGAALTDVKQSPAIGVTVNRFDAAGSVLYWSTAETAVMRILAGGGTATRFYPKEKTGQCNGCHELAESSQWMVVTQNGVNGTFQVVDVNEPSAPTLVHDTADTKRMTFHALSPDGRLLLGVLQGNLVIYDIATNTQIAEVTPDSGYYTHPAWAPDGQTVLATRATGSYLSDMGLNGSEIVTMHWTGSALTNVEVLIPAEPGQANYYASYSPDGNWIVFNRSTGDTYADLDASVWLISAAGGNPIRLDAANGEGELRNSLARWAPLPDDDILWLAFSSLRDRGSVVGRVGQIWITAVDPALAGAGLDPSSAPYWLPGQDANSDNHLPVWWSQ